MEPAADPDKQHVALPPVNRRNHLQRGAVRGKSCANSKRRRNARRFELEEWLSVLRPRLERFNPASRHLQRRLFLEEPHPNSVHIRRQIPNRHKLQIAIYEQRVLRRTDLRHVSFPQQGLFVRTHSTDSTQNIPSHRSSTTSKRRTRRIRILRNAVSLHVIYTPQHLNRHAPVSMGPCPNRHPSSTHHNPLFSKQSKTNIETSKFERKHPQKHSYQQSVPPRPQLRPGQPPEPALSGKYRVRGLAPIDGMRRMRSSRRP